MTHIMVVELRLRGSSLTLRRSRFRGGRRRIRACAANSQKFPSLLFDIIEDHHSSQRLTSVLFDSAMLCWMPVLSAAQEEIKEVCVCGAKNEGFNLVQNPNPMQRNACPPSSTCRATGAGKGSWHLCTHTDEGSDGHVASREHHLPYPQTLFECFGVYPH
jgi:hypothetical protein